MASASGGGGIGGGVGGGDCGGVGGGGVQEFNCCDEG